MHLAHEKKTLMWTIMLPCVFVLWLIAALFIQADAIYNAIYY
jgi:cytochrome c oxidase subunit IV